MTIFSSLDMASADTDFSFLDHESSMSIQDNALQEQILSFTSDNHEQTCPDHCPDCHECHFGHCGIVLENKIAIISLNTESNFNKYEKLFMSRDFHSVFRPPIVV